MSMLEQAIEKLTNGKIAYAEIIAIIATAKQLTDNTHSMVSLGATPELLGMLEAVNSTLDIAIEGLWQADTLTDHLIELIQS
jgi:hypothetical protein